VTQPWLHIVGIGEDGRDGLRPATRTVVDEAEVIFGGARHVALSGNTTARHVPWPSPFDAMIEAIRAEKGQRVVVLATGDPLWYSVGARIGRQIDPREIIYHPQLSAFQLAACHLGWSLADVETLTLHGRAFETMIPFVAPGQRLLILSTGAETPSRVAEWLTAHGYGESRIFALAHLGGSKECHFDAKASSWFHNVPEFNILGVECVAGHEARILPRVGLPDDVFQHDGKMTKSEVRAVNLSRLMPSRGAVLWDVGAGCGSIGIEWLRAARDTRAIAIEPLAERRALAATNAATLGAPRLEVVAGVAPEALAGLTAPDAVFIGGGLSEAVFEAAWTALKSHGRLVSNAVTLESEAVLVALHARYGGSLTKIAIQRAEPVGPMTGWKPLMPVTQWSIVK